VRLATGKASPVGCDQSSFRIVLTLRFLVDRALPRRSRSRFMVIVAGALPGWTGGKVLNRLKQQPVEEGRGWRWP